MTQPEFVPIGLADGVRPADRLPAHGGWTADRPGDAQVPGPPTGKGFGSTGADLGFGLKLAKRFHDRIEVTEGEAVEDAIAGGFAVATKRASMFHRAPVIHDLELAYTLWGFLGGAPADLIEFRKPLFDGAADDYWAQRAICDAVPHATLRLTPAQMRDRLGDWKARLRH